MVMKALYSVMFIVLFIFVVLPGCVGPPEVDTNLPSISTNGMVYYDDSGKYWGIEDDNRTGYKPETLDKQFQKQGLKVSFTARLLSNPKMGGKWEVPIQITEIKALPEPIATVPGQLQGMGTMTNVPVEGGFFGIIGDNSQKYYPLQPVPDIFKKDGTPVMYTIQVRNDKMTTAMWGTPVDVVELVSLPQPSEYLYGTGKIIYLDYQKTKFGFISNAIKSGGKQKVDAGVLPESMRKEGINVRYLIKPLSPSTEGGQLLKADLVFVEPV